MKQIIIFLTLALAAPSLASAQETRRMELEYVKVTDDCPKVSTAGLATGVGLSSLGIFAGTSLSLTLAPYGDSDRSFAPGLGAFGVSLAAVSVAGLVTSSIFLKRKVQKKRQYQRGQCGYAHDPIIPGVRF